MVNASALTSLNHKMMQCDMQFSKIKDYTLFLESCSHFAYSMYLKYEKQIKVDDEIISLPTKTIHVNRCVRTTNNVINEFASYNAKDEIITIYSNKMDELAELLQCDSMQAEQFVCMHEIFHAIESLEGVQCSDITYIEERSLFGKQKRRGFLSSREVAANYFAYYMTGGKKYETC